MVALRHRTEPQPLVQPVRRAHLRPRRQHDGVVAVLTGEVKARLHQRRTHPAPPRPRAAGSTASIRNSASPGRATSMYGLGGRQNVTAPSTVPPSSAATSSVARDARLPMLDSSAAYSCSPSRSPSASYAATVIAATAA